MHCLSAGANPTPQLFDPTGSNWSSREGNEATKAFGVEGGLQFSVFLRPKKTES